MFIEKAHLFKSVDQANRVGYNFLARHSGYRLAWTKKKEAKSARVQVPKNGTSSAQIFERTPKTSRNTPQNGGVDIWFIRFHFRASTKPIFENCIF